jgi:hypothetical protein
MFSTQSTPNYIRLLAVKKLTQPLAISIQAVAVPRLERRQ